SVSLWDRDRTLVDATANELTSIGRTHAVAADVTNEEDVTRAVEDTTAALGGLDILVANAGISGPNLSLWEYPPDAWRQVVEIDLVGVYLCCRAVVPTFIRQNYGRIVSVASVVGKEGNPNAPAYSAAKAGVIALNKTHGKELAGYDIAVNCVTPDAVRTRI